MQGTTVKKSLISIYKAQYFTAVQGNKGCSSENHIKNIKTLCGYEVRCFNALTFLALEFYI